MAKKQAEVATKPLQIEIPKFDEYYREASAFSPNSRTTFEPFRMSLIKQGKSGVLLEHKSKGEITLPNPFQAVLLYTNNKLQCRCTRLENARDQICRSPNRIHSIHGFECAACPYKDFANGKGTAKAGYQIRTLKEYYLLPIIDGKMYFARFITTVKNVGNIVDLSDNITARMRDSFNNVKDYTRAVVEVNIKKFEENGKQVHRIDPNEFEIVNILDDGTWDELKGFITNLTDFNKNRYISNSAAVKAKHDEWASRNNVTSRPAPAKPADQPVTAAPAAAGPITPSPVEAAGIDDVDEEDLPF